MGLRLRLKRKAVKVEELPEPETKQVRYRSLVISNVKKKTNRYCFRCSQLAVYRAYFKVDRCGTLQTERYCPQCLDKWIAIPNQ